MEYLLSQCADVDAVDLLHRSALFLASKKGNLEIVKTLILHQADPFLVTKNGHSADEVCTNEFIRLYIKKTKQVQLSLYSNVGDDLVTMGEGGQEEDAVESLGTLHLLRPTL